jgi:hypothetical protein
LLLNQISTHAGGLLVKVPLELTLLPLLPLLTLLTVLTLLIAGKTLGAVLGPRLTLLDVSTYHFIRKQILIDSEFDNVDLLSTLGKLGRTDRCGRPFLLKGRQMIVVK